MENKNVFRKRFTLSVETSRVEFVQKQQVNIEKNLCKERNLITLRLYLS